MPVTVFVAVTLVFLALQWIPGEPFHALDVRGVDRESVDQLRRVFGEDRPVLRRYADWVGGAVRGDLGVSIRYRSSVSGLIGRAVVNSLPLAAVALLIEFLLGGALALVAARRTGGLIDRLLVRLGAVLYATPTYVMALLVLSVFATGLGWLPVSQMRSVHHMELPLWGRLFDSLRHLVAPALSLGLPAAGGIALYLREELRSVHGQPFITTATARGLAPATVLRRHTLRNSAIPLVHLLGLSLPGVIGGSVIVETIFAWPGLGRLAYEAVAARDRPLVLGCTVVAGIAVIVGGFVADALAYWVDPRLRRKTCG